MTLNFLGVGRALLKIAVELRGLRRAQERANELLALQLRAAGIPVTLLKEEQDHLIGSGDVDDASIIQQSYRDYAEMDHRTLLYERIHRHSPPTGMDLDDPRNFPGADLDDAVSLTEATGERGWYKPHG